MELTSKQRAQLRGLANSIDTILQVGKDGIGANLIKQADDALAGNDQRGTGFVDENGVHLVDDGVVKLSLYQLLFVDHHVVTKVVETVLVVGYISDIAGILGAALVVIHGVQDTAAGQA